MDLGLGDRVALITGSSRGIGKASALLFGNEGAKVAVTYRCNLDQAEAVANEIQHRGGEALVCQLDLASRDSIRNAVDSVLTKWGRVDVLVNNAVETRVREPQPEESQREDWQTLLRVNLEGTYQVMSEVTPGMKKNSWGRIVNISSVMASDGIPRLAWYAAAKSALHGLTRSLFRDLGREGILLNVVMPGLTLTESVIEGFHESVISRNAQKSPLKRLLSPEEVARVVVFLGSPANTGVTGEIVRASGGV